MKAVASFFHIRADIIALWQIPLYNAVRRNKSSSTKNQKIIDMAIGLLLQ